MIISISLIEKMLCLQTKIFILTNITCIIVLLETVYQVLLFFFKFALRPTEGCVEVICVCFFFLEGEYQKLGFDFDELLNCLFYQPSGDFFYNPIFFI